MPRIVCIYLPNWPLERLRRAQGRSRSHDASSTPRSSPTTTHQQAPLQTNGAAVRENDPPAVVLTHAHGGRQVVAAASPRACRAGIRPGLTLAHARALLPPGALEVQPHRPQRDERALVRLSRWLMRFAPSVQADPPDGVLLDIAGCAHLFGGEAGMLLEMRRVLQRLGFTVRLAAAPTLGAAWALARHAEKPVVSIEAAQVRQALAPLPLAALRLKAKTVSDLAELGLTHVADVLALPRSTIPARFGAEALLRLDQALGEAVELLKPLTPQSQLEHALAFDGPTTQLEAVQEATRQLLQMLQQSLQQREAGVRTLALTIERALLEPIVIPLSVSRPCRDPKHLWSLLAPHLETIHLGHGVDEVRLAVRHSARLPHTQLRYEPAQSDAVDRLGDGRLGKLIDTLISTLGRSRVTRSTARQTHVPEDRFRLTPIDEAPPTNVQGFAADFVHRPSCLLPEPLPLRVDTDERGLPSRLALPWSREFIKVVVSAGPECIAARWWDGPLPRAAEATDDQSFALLNAASSTRMYFRVRLSSGHVLWIYQSRPRRDWRLHGIWS